MGQPNFYSDGNTPKINDTSLIVEQKILGALRDLESGLVPPTSGLNGSGSPEGVVTASPGASYLDTTNHQVYWKNSGTGNTGWE